MRRMKPYTKANQDGHLELREEAEKAGEVWAHRTIAARLLGVTTSLMNQYAASDDLSEFRRYA